MAGLSLLTSPSSSSALLDLALMLCGLVLTAHSSSFGDKSAHQTVFLQHRLMFMSASDFQNPNVNAEDRIAWTNIFCFEFSLDFFLFFCYRPISFWGRERKEELNIFSVQSFMLFLMADSDSPCNCYNQVAEGTHSESISFCGSCLSGLRM